MAKAHPVTSACIDVPLKSAVAHLFVRPEFESWDPWWRALYEYLLGLMPRDLDWQPKPLSTILIARPALDERIRWELRAFLRTAPAAEVATRPTLRRAVELSDEKVERLSVVYFSEP